MPHSYSSRRALRLVACGAALAVASPLSAQESRVIIAGGQGANVVTLSSLALSDSAVRRLIETHLPDAFTDDADAYHVLLVLDANGEYVSGKASKATVVTPAISVNGDNAFVVGDSLGGAGVARVMVRRLDGATTSAGAAPAVTFMRRDTDGGIDSHHGVMGSGYEMSEVSSVGLRHFTPGQLAHGRVMVSVVRLK